MDKIFSLFAFLAAGVFAAGLPEGTVLRGFADKPEGFYQPGEKMVFAIAADSSNAKEPLPEGWKIAWERTGDDGKVLRGEGDARAPVMVATSLAEPGFVRVVAHLVSPEGWTNFPENVSFNGGAGVQPEKLLGGKEPADFDAFWKKRRDLLYATPLDGVIRKELETKHSSVRVYSLEIPCPETRVVTGYLSIPVKEPGTLFAAGLTTDGYGTHIPWHISNPPETTILLHINAHGVELDREKSYYDEFFASIRSNGHGYGFDPAQNARPETSYFYGMALRVMRALQYLKSLPEWNGKDLWAAGGSQGGLQTVWAAALDPAVTSADAGIPWNCDFQGKANGRIIDPWHVQYAPGLDYFDPVFHARRVSKACDFKISRAGLGDYCCPPSGVSALFNNLPCKKSITWVQGSTHGFVPTQPNQSFTIKE